MLQCQAYSLTKSRLQMEQASGVVNGEDMDLAMNESIDDSIGALDDFPNGRVIDLWNDAPGLRECGQPFDRGD